MPTLASSKSQVSSKQTTMNRKKQQQPSKDEMSGDESMVVVGDKINVTTKKIKLQHPVDVSDDEVQETPSYDDMIDDDTDEQDDDSSQDDNEDDEDEVLNNPAPYHKDDKSASLYRAPTNDEIMNLKQTSQLFQSNLFKLQISELLSQVSPGFVSNPNSKASLQKLLFKLKSTLENDKTCNTPMTLDELVKNESPSVLDSIPFPSPKPTVQDTLYTFAYNAPSKIAMGGSFLMNSMVKSPQGFNIDMILMMPKELFQEKDYVNYRYFHKRAYYLYCVATILSKKLDEFGSFDMEYEYFLNDSRRPILVLSNFKDIKGSTNDSANSKLVIRLIPSIETTVFTPSRLGPLRGNIRKSTTAGVGVPSPMYNASILADSAYLAHLNFLHAATTMAPAFSEAVSLGKVWIHQRGLNHPRGYGFNGFILSMIMAWLLQSKPQENSVTSRLSKTASSYQMLKVTLDFLAKHDFDSSPLFLTSHAGPLPSQPEFSKDAFQRNFDVSIVDPLGFVNLTYGMTLGAMKHVQYEARCAMALFQNTQEDCFAPLFLESLDKPELFFDHLVRLRVPRRVLSKKAPADYADQMDYLLSEIPKLLREALGNRVHLVTAFSTTLHRFSLTRTASTSSSNDIFDLSIGLLLDAENSLRVVELGPDPSDASSSTAVERFQQVWGSKVELRRFQDGSIRHAVLFEGKDDSFEERAGIVSRMIGYLIQRHFLVATSSSTDTKVKGSNKQISLVTWGTSNQVTRFLTPMGLKAPIKSFQPVMEAFQSFSKQLKSLRDLPLSVSQVLPSSSGLCYSSTMIPQPMPDESKLLVGQHPYVEPLSVVIEFESSGKWPDDLSAIQVMKQAFYIRLASELEKAYPGTECAIFSGNGKNLMDSGYMDVSHGDSGYVFRCRIHHDREATLISRALTLISKRKAGVLSQQDDEDIYNPTEELKRLKEINITYRALFHEGPKHVSELSNACLRHSHLGPSIRLVKRWLASHFLLNGGSNFLSSSRLHKSSEGVSEQIVEALVKRLFLRPGARSPPSSAWVGFLRMLDFLSSTDLDTLLEEVALALKETCSSSSSTTSVGGSVLSVDEVLSDVPRKIWIRVKMLATSAIAFVRQNISSGNDDSISTLFSTPVQGYHAILHLNKTLCSKFYQNVFHDSSSAPCFKNVVSSLEKSLAILTQIDPVTLFLQDLVSAFGNIAMFFADACGGDKILLVWKPTHDKTSSSSLIPLKTNLQMNVCLPAQAFEKSGKLAGKNKKKEKNAPETNGVQVNRLAMLAEMQRLSGGLVVGIQLLTSADSQ